MKAVLTRLAEATPASRLDSRLVWRRGRTRRTLRRIGTMAAVIGLALAVPPFLPTPPVSPAAVDGVAIPQRFGRPYPWQATIGSSPNGPALAYFSTTLLDDDNDVFPRAAVVGRDGSYRLHFVAGLESLGLLSPDGTIVAAGGVLVDLTTGQRHGFTTELTRALAWSRDGRRLVVVIGPVDGPRRLEIYDRVENSFRSLPPPTGYAVAAAFSPDGTNVAVLDRLTLGVFRVDGEKVAEGSMGSTPSNHVLLAAPAAWTPDGRSIVLTSNTLREGRQHWRLLFFDLATRTFSEQAGAERFGWAYSIAGWLGSDPVVAVLEGRSTLQRLAPDGTAQVLTSADTVDLQIPQDLIEAGEFGGPPAQPQIFAAQWWAYAVVILVLLVIGLLGRAIWRGARWCRASRLRAVQRQARRRRPN